MTLGLSLMKFSNFIKRANSQQNALENKNISQLVICYLSFSEKLIWRFSHIRLAASMSENILAPRSS